MADVRAKFRVVSKTENAGTDGGAVKLVPVMNGSPENAEFYKYTPGGSIDLTTINQAAFERFGLGQECYVDFTFVQRSVTAKADLDSAVAAQEKNRPNYRNWPDYEARDNATIAALREKYDDLVRRGL